MRHFLALSLTMSTVAAFVGRPPPSQQQLPSLLTLAVTRPPVLTPPCPPALFDDDDACPHLKREEHEIYTYEIADPEHSLRHKLGVLDSPPLPPPATVGHRGALYDCLENTRESFLRCTQLGCDAVELDVFLLKDGKVVVFHGAGSDAHPGLLDGYCVGTSPDASILDLTYEQCQQLTFNTKFGEFSCPKDRIRRGHIPTLDQVLLDLRPFATQVKIELKGPKTADAVIRLVEELNMQDRCTYSSFEHDHIRRVHELRPHYATGALFDEVPDDFVKVALEAGASEVHLRYDTCTRARVEAIHAAGLKSMAWFRGTVGMRLDCDTKFWDVGNENESCYQAVIDTGVQQICCNRPDVLMAMVLRQELAAVPIQ